MVEIHYGHKEDLSSIKGEDVSGESKLSSQIKLLKRLGEV